MSARFYSFDVLSVYYVLLFAVDFCFHLMRLFLFYIAGHEIKSLFHTQFMHISVSTQVLCLLVHILCRELFFFVTCSYPLFPYKLADPHINPLTPLNTSPVVRSNLCLFNYRTLLFYLPIFEDFLPFPFVLIGVACR